MGKEIICNHKIAPGGDGHIIHALGCPPTIEENRKEVSSPRVGAPIDPSALENKPRVSGGT